MKLRITRRPPSLAARGVVPPANVVRRTMLLACALSLGASVGAPGIAAAADETSAQPTPAERCSAEQRTDVLRREQREVMTRAPRVLDSLDAATRPGGPLAGWRLSHGHVVLAGAGAVGLDNLDAEPPLPPLLLYAPSPDSDPKDWLDFDGEDGPYTLVGWAYIGPWIDDGTPPPRRPCIDASEWFVHEAGWHLMDGGMLLTPGATAEPARPPGLAAHFWHPRAWDLHVWADDDGVPTVAFHNPRARRGGLALPEGAFLTKVDGELQPLS